MKPLLATTMMLAGLGLTSAHAMTACAARDAVISSLSEKYQESHFASGLQSATGLMELWASDDAGTWTILLTRPDGQSCVVASGTHWLEKPRPTTVSGDPA